MEWTLRIFWSITAEDGVEGLKKLNNYCDLILLDLMMPKMSGEERYGVL